MLYMNRYLVICVTFLVVFQLLPLEGASAASPGQKVWRIGAILPLSGESAALGRYVQNGLRLGWETMPEEEREHFELLFEDDAWKVSNSLNAFHKLLELEHADVIFVVGSAVANAI